MVVHPLVMNPVQDVQLGQEIIKKVHDMILNDRRMKVQKIIEPIGISHGTVSSILYEKLSMEKLSVRYGCRMYSPSRLNATV